VFRWLEAEKGTPVRVGDGHAAVIGYETCQIHYPSRLRHELSRMPSLGWEGARSRTIRKPENLPECASQ
jgi:hypothetical protein